MTMRYKVNFETKVGLAFFGEVYRGAWRWHTVAIKVLAESTPRKIFGNKDKIWKSLYSLNMIELLGASSVSDDRWLLVREYLSFPDYLLIYCHRSASIILWEAL